MKLRKLKEDISESKKEYVHNGNTGKTVIEQNE